MPFGIGKLPSEPIRPICTKNIQSAKDYWAEYIKLLVKGRQWARYAASRR